MHLGRLLLVGVICSATLLLVGLLLSVTNLRPALADWFLNAGLLVLMATPRAPRRRVGRRIRADQGLVLRPDDAGGLTVLVVSRDRWEQR